jgi:multiple sugar transport system permease protein
VATEVIRAGAARAASRRRRIVDEHIAAYLFLLPAIVIIGMFKVFPAFFAFYISLFRWDVIQGAFRGLDNYLDILFANPTRAEQFWRSLSTTATYTLITIPLEIAIAMGIAFLLFSKMRGRGFYRTVYYLPYVTSTVAAATAFEWLFHPQYGSLNDLLGLVGIGPQDWLSEPDGVFALVGSAAHVSVPEWAAGPSLALVAVSLFSVWHYIGFQAVIFLAGLANISPEYYEAARLDGASELQIFRKITFPLLSPTTFFVFTIATIGALKAFNQIYVLTNGGPLDTTRTVTMLVFRTFFQQTQLGLGAAMAFLLTLVIVVGSIVQFRILGRRVFYG